MDNEFRLQIEAILEAAKARTQAKSETKKMMQEAQEVANQNPVKLKITEGDVKNGLRSFSQSLQREQSAIEKEMLSSQKKLTKEWQGIFKDSVNNLTSKNPVASQMKSFYQEQEKQAQSAYKTYVDYNNRMRREAQERFKENTVGFGKVSNPELERLNASLLSQQQKGLEIEKLRVAEQRKYGNGLDWEIQKREHASKSFASQLKAQMEAQRVEYTEKLNADNVISQMNSYKYNNTKAFSIFSDPKFAQEFNNIQDGLKNGTILAEDASKRFDTLKNNIDATGKSGKTFGGIMADELKSFARWTIASTLVMTPIRAMKQAISAMKDVDSELVNIQKVTNATAEEMKNLTKQAYSMATAYGRSPVEFLKSVTSFARAGYDEASSSLGELSLLAQNVGDVEQELADKFLVSADAAWQYGGNIEKLRAILDGFNELSNKTATTVDNLADGITVAGSVFAQAGLTAQDYAGIVGTATAKTQRDGNEMARAWRTILMNIRQISGTDLETGEVIDSDSLAKAEKTLNGIGISIREVVNGQNELRNPMSILRELAEQWKDLNSVQQSAIQEALAGRLLPERIEMCA